MKIRANKKLSGLMGLTILVATIARAADLNAPVQKKITVGSELQRGGNAAADCALDVRTEMTRKYGDSDCCWDTFVACITSVSKVESGGVRP
jgi:hypothetical protein